jgi:hypothetical protein
VDFLLSHGLRFGKQVTPISRISRFIFKPILNGVNVERRTIADQEVRHVKPGQCRERYFAWLCVNK